MLRKRHRRHSPTPTTVPASAGVATEPATAAVERIGIDESDDDDADWSGDDCGSDDEIVLD